MILKMPLPVLVQQRLKNVKHSVDITHFWQRIHKCPQNSWKYFGLLGDCYGNEGDDDSQYICNLIYSHELQPFGGFYIKGWRTEKIDETHAEYMQMLHNYRWLDNDVSVPSLILKTQDILYQEFLSRIVSGRFRRLGDEDRDFTEFCNKLPDEKDAVLSLLPPAIRNVPKAFNAIVWGVQGTINPATGRKWRRCDIPKWRRGFATKALAYEALFVAYHLSITK